MLNATVYSLGDPGTFDIVDKDDPQYYIARLSHEMSENLYNLQTAGFDFKQMENSDFASFENAFDTYRTNIAAWFDTAVQDSMDGDPIESVPAIPDITDIIPWIGSNPWVAILVRVIIDVGIRWIRKKLDSDTDSKELTQVIRQAFIGEIDSTEYPLMELLANIPIQVIISQWGQLQDVMLNNYTE